MGRRLALLIASYDYQDPGLRQLTAPARDAEALAAVLEDPQIAGFEVTTLINEPHYRVGEAIGDFYRHPRRDDTTLLYFTGHGLKDDGGRLYLAMNNTRRDVLMYTSVSADQINQSMDGCMSRHKVLVLDCCYSGAFPEGRSTKGDSDVHALERFQGRGRTVLTASDSTQYSFEGNQIFGQAAASVFTRYLVEGLRDGTADLDGDGDITVDELYSYVHDRVVEEIPEQRPKKQDNVEGRTVIARNIHWSLPRYLRNNLSSPIASDKLLALEGLARLSNVGNDIVRASVRAEIELLVDDDSRTVSSAAVAALQGLDLRAAAKTGPVRQIVTGPVPVIRLVQPEPEPEPEPDPEPETEPESSLEPEPPLEPAPEPPPEPEPEPLGPEALIAAAERFETDGDLEQAEAWYRRAAELDSAAGMYGLAAVLERRGELDDAESWYRRAAATSKSDSSDDEGPGGRLSWW